MDLLQEWLQTIERKNKERMVPIAKTKEGLQAQLQDLQVILLSNNHLTQQICNSNNINWILI